MEVRELEYVVTLAEELHFGRAARRHFISEQPFGRRIREVEQELGIRLFARTSRRVMVTPHGVEFVRRARMILDGVHDLADLTPRSISCASLNVGILGFGAGLRWPTLLTHLPNDSSITYRELDFTNSRRALLDGDVDAAVIQHVGPVPGIVFDTLCTSARVMVVRSDSALAGRRRLTEHDIVGQPRVGISSGDADVARWAGLDDSPQEVRAMVTNPASIPTMVAATGGISLHAADAATHYAHPGVQFVPVDGEPVRVALATRLGDEREQVLGLRRAAQHELSPAPI